jgi:Cu2+-exporting ATPase
MVPMTACFHCGLPVDEPGRYRARILGAEREMCCAGCAAVAGTIAGAGLEEYYETRTQAAAPSQPFPEPAGLSGEGAEASLILERVRCSACLWLIERTLRRLDGVTRADVSYATRRAQVSWDPRRARLADVVRAVRAVGYDAQPYTPRRQEELERRESRAALWRLFVAGFAAMQVMMYAFPAYFGAADLDAESAQLLRWAAMLLTTPVLVFSCRPFFAGAAQELRQRRLGLDVPIALGLAGGFAASAWAAVAGSGEVYFDSVSMLAFLLLAARTAEAAARRRATRALDRLVAWQPSAALAPGDRVTVAPGASFPADGIVESGASSADESLLTGEARPLAKREGDAVAGGSVNLEQPLVMRVTRAGADTQAAAIARLAERAATERPRLVEAADRVARALTPLIVLCAIAAGLWHASPWVALAVLVATCPCALALAAPIVLTRAGATLLARGALLTRARALETLDRVTDVVLDKTGTLTQGRLSLARTVPLGALDAAGCIAFARALESSSRHPVSRAFGGDATLAVENVRNVPGEGIEGRIQGRTARIGTESFCRAPCGTPTPNHPSFDDTRVFLATEEGWLAAFELADEAREDAGALVAGLKARGLRVHLASGDRPEVGAALAQRLWIGSAAGGMAPADKCAFVERLQREGRVVAVVGDGLNDIPVLARADVSFAMGGGADAAQLRADVVLTRDSLQAVLDSFAVASRAMRLVRQNLAWALAYNAIALPLAAIGWIGPWEAALGMGTSSAIVLLNALRPLERLRTWKASTYSSRSRSPSYS